MNTIQPFVMMADREQYSKDLASPFPPNMPAKPYSTSPYINLVSPLWR